MEAKTTHTAGPWRDTGEIFPAIEGLVIRSAVGRVIACVGDFIISGRDADRGANARLIAAAPELLWRLECMVREWRLIIGDEEHNSTPADTLEKAVEVIAKAKGGIMKTKTVRWRLREGDSVVAGDVSIRVKHLVDPRGSRATIIEFTTPADGVQVIRKRPEAKTPDGNR